MCKHHGQLHQWSMKHGMQCCKQFRAYIGSEYVAQSGSQDQYWKFVVEVTKSLSQDSVNTDQSTYDAISTVAKKVLSAGANLCIALLMVTDDARMLQYALSVHLYAPQVEMYHQLYAQTLSQHEGIVSHRGYKGSNSFF